MSRTSIVMPSLYRSSGALHPTLFCVAHLALSHVAARALPAKRITYPLVMAHGVLLFASEHLAAELPTLAEVGPAIGAGNEVGHAVEVSAAS